MVSASRYVGRVGGLAAALGIGAAVFSIGCGIASADSGNDTGPTSRATSAAAAERGSSGGSTESSRRVRTAPGTPNAAAHAAGGNTVRSRAVTTIAAPAPNAEPDTTVPDLDNTTPVATAPVTTAPEPAAPVITAPVTPVADTAVAAPAAAAAPEDAAADTPAAALVGLAAAAGAASVGAVIPEITPSVCTESSEKCAYIVGPSGVPIPNQTYVNQAMAWYVEPNSLDDQSFTTQVIFTPEGAYPITGVKQLPIDPSSQEGLTEVRETVEATLQVLQPGTPISYFGYSQSAIISSLFQIYQAGCAGSTCPPPAPPAEGDWPIENLDPSQVTFITVGQEMNPNGGWFSRFTGFIAPGPGLVFYGATPEEPWAGRTVNYTLEYDGFADYPRYPLNFLSSLNAAMGILLVHTQYASANYFGNTYRTIDPLLAEFGPGTACQGSSTACLQLPTTAGTEDSQQYYFIQTPNLPLLAPLRAIPLIGTPLADLIQPALKVIVDLGYADWAHGFGTEADQPLANVLLEFGVFPDVNPLEVINKLVAGVQQGISDFIADLMPGGSVSQELSMMASTIQKMTSDTAATITALASQPFTLPSLSDVVTTVQNVVSEVTERTALAASALYATLLPLADFANAFVFSFPGYAVNLFLDGLEQAVSGDLIEGLVNAIGRPVAAAVGFATIIGVFQTAVFLLGAVAAVTGCGPAAPVTGFCTIG
ncbi:MAG: PE-PPE domain-containing protein [Mycobacterium sp.]|nr:PE-PPE domain-containing protein [Mycobacterium sp.]